MTAKSSEDDLCRAFAEKVATSDDFRSWLLHQTKFRQHRFGSRVLKNLQAQARPKVLPERWWRHWFWRIPELGKEHETDVLLLLEAETCPHRFALHVEVKLGSSLSVGQAASYGPRARHVMANETRLPHGDVATLLVAPARLIGRYVEDAALFDSVVSLEAIAVFIPDFEEAMNQLGMPAVHR